MNIIRRRSKYPLLSPIQPKPRVCEQCGKKLTETIEVWRKQEINDVLVQVMFKREYVCMEYDKYLPHTYIRKFTPFIATTRRLELLKVLCNGL